MLYKLLHSTFIPFPLVSLKKYYPNSNYLQRCASNHLRRPVNDLNEVYHCIHTCGYVILLRKKKKKQFTDIFEITFGISSKCFFFMVTTILIVFCRLRSAFAYAKKKDKKTNSALFNICLLVSQFSFSCKIAKCWLAG